MPNRRKFLQSMSSVPLLGGALPRSAIGALVRPDYFKDMKISHFINAGEPYTTLSGSAMLPEVVQAMEYAARQPVRLNDVHDAVGERIASLTGVRPPW